MPVTLTDAQRGIIEAECWHALEAAHPTILIPDAVRTHWSDGESFVILADGEVDQFHYDTDSKASKRVPGVDIILSLLEDGYTQTAVAAMYDCSQSGISHKLTQARRAVEATGARIAGVAISRAVAAVRG